MTKGRKGSTTRITDQFHGKQGMVYSLRCEGLVVNISIAHCEQETEWEARATVKMSSDPLVATGVGRSRIEAFRGLHEAWRSQREKELPRLDWEAIQEALVSVRAI